MKNLARRTRTVLILSAAMLLVAGQSTEGCAPAPRRGAIVSIVGESAVIVWDASTRTEHFIRRASFDTDTSDFGFLVPTPTLPVLAEAKDEAFTHLERLIQPEIIYRVESHLDFTPLVFFPFLSMRETASAPAGQAVRVLDVQRVAGYDAVVLEADDAAALAEWLRKHGYDSRPELSEWLAPYISKKWKITAFKIAKDPAGKQVSTSAVRMSFETEQPFFPYSEPADQRKSSQQIPPARMLQVLFLSNARMSGAIGGGLWSGRTIWARRLQESEQSSLARELALSADQLPKDLWMTVFEDASSPRPGTADLYFSESVDQTPILTPPVVVTHNRRIPVPVDVILVIVAAPIVVMLIRRRRNSARRTTIRRNS